MTMVRVIKCLDYQHVYELQVKRWWFPFYTNVTCGGKDEMIELAQQLVTTGRLNPNVVYESAILK